MLKKHFEKAVAVLVALSSKGLGGSSRSKLARQIGFNTAADGDFKTVLAELQKEGIIEIQESEKVVVLKPDLILDRQGADGFLETERNPYALLEWKGEKEDREIAPSLSLLVKGLAAQFFQSIFQPHYKRAKKILKRMARIIDKSQWFYGYFQALKGILLQSQSRRDKYSFLADVDFSSKEDLERLHKTFKAHAKSERHAPFDRGFFTAWTQLTRFGIKFFHKNSRR